MNPAQETTVLRTKSHIVTEYSGRRESRLNLSQETYQKDRNSLIFFLVSKGFYFLFTKEFKMLRFAIYGKGGIGKSTIASNLSAAFSFQNKKVLHIGCDPKGDSSRNLMGYKIPTVIEKLKLNGAQSKLDIVFSGFLGVECVETGGPNVGMGCAGRGIVTTMQELEEFGVLGEKRDIIVYDVLGDVVCGGFAIPMKEKYVDVIYIVTSDEYMSFYAANNILKALHYFSEWSSIKFGGIIFNERTKNSNMKCLEKFLNMTKTELIGKIPYSKKIIQSELQAKTIAELYPETIEFQIFQSLANNILNKKNYSIPKFLSDKELEILSSEMLNILE